ncbi:MAG: molybdopterin molybdenumtransferase MoeA [Rhodospirillales bacterium]|nr:molybdopterin molybdenumtransferase MoeA [Rhodospirillales bacterium]
MISVAEALENVIRGVAVVAAEVVPLADGLGRVLAEDVQARLTHPPVAVSAMDGYAVRVDDVARVPATLKRIGESAAGRGFDGRVGAGEAVRTFTGAPVPDGADAIVIQEDTEAQGDRVVVKEAPKRGRFIRPAGLDFKKGDTLLKAGRVLGALDIGLAAAMNVPWLRVRRRPRVAIITTGDEVVHPGDPIGPHQIVGSNSLTLAASVRAWGGEPVDLGIAPDTVEALTRMIDGARGADLIVTSGGASVGDHDLVQKALGNRGFELRFYRVAMRPGKPLIFGRVGETPFLGLPGNPVSVGVTSVLFLKPAIETMLGIARDRQPAPAAILGRDLAANDQRQDYLRATLARNGSGVLVATPFDQQDSSMLGLLAAADCLVIRAPHTPAIKAGEPVEVIPLRGGVLL